MEVLTQAKTSRKRKRDETSESESSEHVDAEMAGNPPDISNEVDDLLQLAQESAPKPMRTKSSENLPNFMTPKEQ